jgi:hypothetical protein
MSDKDARSLSELDSREVSPVVDDEGLDPAPKRLFIGLICGTSLIIVAGLALLWIIPYIGLTNIHPLAPWFFGALLGSCAIVVLWACFGLVLNILLGRSFFFAHRIRGLMVKIFLPLMTILARIFGVSKRRVRNSFIHVNNELVRSEAGRYPAEKILLLLPHCLQSSTCKFRLTYDVNNCRRCGLCPIKGLLDIHDIYGMHLSIATGGTIARRIVVHTRPKFILAVACERDLASGIQDVFPLPAYGVLNQRPNGPCLDTLVPLEDVERALQRFMNHEDLEKAKARKQTFLAEKAERQARRAAKKKSALEGADPDASSGSEHAPLEQAPA